MIQGILMASVYYRKAFMDKKEWGRGKLNPVMGFPSLPWNRKGTTPTGTDSISGLFLFCYSSKNI
jgi:hypothetical protein